MSLWCPKTKGRYKMAQVSGFFYHLAEIRRIRKILTNTKVYFNIWLIWLNQIQQVFDLAICAKL